MIVAGVTQATVVLAPIVELLSKDITFIILKPMERLDLDLSALESFCNKLTITEPCLWLVTSNEY